MYLKNKLAIAGVVLGMGLSGASMAETTEEAIDRLSKELNEMKSMLSATADAVDNAAAGSQSRIGGYGELHYNDIDGKDAVLDFHRFVLFFSHQFSDSIRFYSELELEHAFIEDSDDGESPGEVELEQAFVEFDLNGHTQAKAGVFLVPVGIINETHEPPAFYGVERNPVEKNIIPATWWEPGAALSGQIGDSGLSYDIAVHGGLKVDPATVKLRSGRQKGAEAIAENLALTGRIKYTGISGLELAGSVNIQDDLSQVAGDGLEGAVLLAIHAIWNQGPMGLKALYAAWDIDGQAAQALNKDQQDGYFVEASYKFTPKVGVFARHNGWSVVDGVDATQQDIGFNWWPHEQVVLKADIQRQNDDAGNKDGFNLGIGYQF